LTSGNIKIIEMLKKQTNLNASNNNGQSLFHYLASIKNVEILELFKDIDVKTDLFNLKDNIKKQTPLHYGVSKNNTNFISFLITTFETLDLNVKDEEGNKIIVKQGNTPLMLAVLNQAESSVLKLFTDQKNINLNIKNKQNKNLKTEMKKLIKITENKTDNNDSNSKSNKKNKKKGFEEEVYDFENISDIYVSNNNWDSTLLDEYDKNDIVHVKKGDFMFKLKELESNYYFVQFCDEKLRKNNGFKLSKYLLKELKIEEKLNSIYLSEKVKKKLSEEVIKIVDENNFVIEVENLTINDTLSIDDESSLNEKNENLERLMRKRFPEKYKSSSSELSPSQIIKKKKASRLSNNSVDSLDVYNKKFNNEEKKEFPESKKRNSIRYFIEKFSNEKKDKKNL
jgi:hypothetical protein